MPRVIDEARLRFLAGMIEASHLKTKPKTPSSRQTQLLWALLTVAPSLGALSLLFWFQPSQLLASIIEVLAIASIFVGLLIFSRLRRAERDERAFFAQLILTQEETALFDRWKLDGNLATIIKGLTESQIQRLGLVSQKVFGTFLAGSGTFPNGKKWEVKLPAVGLKILVVGYYDRALRFDVILYRRDLANAGRIRRPWRRVSFRDGSIQLLRPYQVVQLPNWIG